MKPTPYISHILENIALTYERVKAVLESKLATRGYNIIEEKYHPEAFGSRYVVWSNKKDAIRLLWDGKDEWFYLQSLDVLPSDLRDDWKDLVYTPFDPKLYSPTHVHDLQVKIVEGLGWVEGV